MAACAMTTTLATKRPTTLGTCLGGFVFVRGGGVRVVCAAIAIATATVDRGMAGIVLYVVS